MPDDDEDAVDDNENDKKDANISTKVDIDGQDEWEEVSDDDEDEEDDDDNCDEQDDDSDDDGMMEDDDEEEDEDNTNEPPLVSDGGSTAAIVTSHQSVETLSSIRGRLDARRVLTDADFALINKLRTAHLARTLDPKYRGKNSFQLTHNATALLKRKHALEDEEDGDGGDSYHHSDYAVNPDTLAPGARSEKTSKIDRITHVLEGRKEKRFEKEKHPGGLTNTEKLRKKNFMMVRKGKREVRGKISKSNSTTRYEKMHKKEQLGRDRRKRRRT